MAAQGHACRVSLEWKEVGRWVADHLGRVRLLGVFGWAFGDTGIPDVIGKTLQVCAFRSGRKVHAFHRLSKKADTARKSVYCLRVWNYAPCMFFSFHLNAKNRKSSLYNNKISGVIPGNSGGGKYGMELYVISARKQSQDWGLT